MIYFIIYTTYILTTVFITFRVGNLLYHDGGIWLKNLLGDFDWVLNLNQLLRIGYFLVNLGYTFYTFNTWQEFINWQNALHELSLKIGFVLLLLGYLHYQNIIIISIFHNLNLQKKWKI